MGVRQAIQIMSLKFVNLCRLMMNVPRPIWMSLSNFIEVLGTSKETREQLSTGLCVYGEDHCSSPKEEVEKHLQSLMDDLRLFDITDPKYWGACFGCVVLFLGVEAFVFHFSTFPFKELVIGFAFGLAMAIVGFFFIYHYYFAQYKLSYALPVFVTAMGLIGLNLILISKTGWASSPFLPALTSLLASP